MQNCFEEILYTFKECKLKAEEYNKVVTDKFALYSLNDIRREFFELLGKNLDMNIYRNIHQLIPFTENGDTNQIIPLLHELENLDEGSKNILRETKRFLTTGRYNSGIVDLSNLQTLMLLPICFVSLNEYWINTDINYRNRNFHILASFLSEFPKIYNPQIKFHIFCNKLINMGEDKSNIYRKLENVFKDTKIIDHNGLLDVFDQMLMIHMGVSVINKTTPIESNKRPLTLFINRNPSLTGKAAANLLKDLTPEQKEIHKLEKTRERNKRRQEKINNLRLLDQLPTNKEKIMELLRMYNPSILNTDQNIVEFYVKFLLDKLGLL